MCICKLKTNHILYWDEFISFNSRIKKISWKYGYKKSISYWKKIIQYFFRIVDIFVWYDETVNMSTMVPKNTFISVTRDEEYDTSIKKTTSYICGAQTV